MTQVTAPKTLIKQPGEDLLYGMDFTNLLATSETITTVTSVSEITTSDLTIGSGTINGSIVEFRVSGGTNGIGYRIEVIIVTSDSNTRVGDGLITVRDS